MSSIGCWMLSSHTFGLRMRRCHCQAQCNDCTLIEWWLYPDWMMIVHWAQDCSCTASLCIHAQFRYFKWLPVLLQLSLVILQEPVWDLARANLYTCSCVKCLFCKRVWKHDPDLNFYFFKCHGMFSSCNSPQLKSILPGTVFSWNLVCTMETTFSECLPTFFFLKVEMIETQTCRTPKLPTLWNFPVCIDPSTYCVAWIHRQDPLITSTVYRFCFTLYVY